MSLVYFTCFSVTQHKYLVINTQLLQHDFQNIHHRRVDVGTEFYVDNFDIYSTGSFSNWEH